MNYQTEAVMQTLRACRKENDTLKAKNAVLLAALNNAHRELFLIDSAKLTARNLDSLLREIESALAAAKKE